MTCRNVDFPFLFEQIYDTRVTETDVSFPADLIALQEELHRLHAEHRDYPVGLPWSVEPVKGWQRGDRWSHRGDVPDSPGWSEEQKQGLEAIRARLRELAGAVVDHPYWQSIEKEKLVAARMLLKKQTRPAEPAPEPAGSGTGGDIAEAA